MRLKKNVVTRNLRKHQLKTGQKSLEYTVCPRKQFTRFQNALIFKLFIAQNRHYTHFKADSSSFEMSTHTLHSCTDVNRSRAAIKLRFKMKFPNAQKLTPLKRSQ